MNKQRIKVRDSWLKNIPNEEYINYVFTAFKEVKNMDGDQDELILEKIQKMLTREKEKERSDEINKLKFQSDINGEDEQFYLLKKGKTMGNLMKREVIVKDLSIVQLKKGKEKDLGKIQEMIPVENTFKGEHKDKYSIQVNLLKDGKRRETHLMFTDYKLPLKKELVQKFSTLLKKTLPQNFKNKVIQKIRLPLEKESKKIQEARKKEMEEKIEQSDAIIQKVFKDFDQKNIVDMIKKWKTEALNIKNSQADAEQQQLRQQQQQDKQRKQDILRKNQTLQNLDKQQITKVMSIAIEKAKDKQIIQQQQQEFHDREKVKRTAPKREKKLEISFKQICLSSNIQYLKPIVDIYYIPNNNVTQYTTHVKDEYIPDPSPKVSNNQYSRTLNGQQWDLQENSEAIFQMVFNTRMISKMNDESFLWDLELNNTFHKELIQLEDNTLRFNPDHINSYLKDAIKISVYDEMDKDRIDKKAKFVQYISVSDLIDHNVQTKQLWINLSFDELKNIKNKVILKANIFKSPSYASQSHNQFEDFMDQFQNTKMEMLDPIYPIYISNVPSDRQLIRQSMNYFLEKVNQEGLGSSNSIRILEFIIDAEQGELIDDEEIITRPEIIKDYRKIFYEAVSMHLTSSYAKNFILSEDKQSQILEKVADEQNPKKIYKVIKNIDRSPKNITYEDLKSLFIIGVPSRYRCLYWTNFLHIDIALRDDIQKDPGYQKNPSDLVERYKYYTYKTEQGIDQSIYNFIKENKEVLGEEQSENLAKILHAFKNYLKFNKIVDLQQEDRLRFHLFKFIMRMFVSLYPSYMKTEENLHSTFFQTDLMTQNSAVSASPIKIKVEGNLSDRAYKDRTNQIRAEIFWYSVAFYNLYYKQFVSMEDEKGLESLKRRLAIGIIAYEQLLNPNSKKIMQQNRLGDIVEDLWFRQYSSFFYLSFQSYNFTKILDIVVFEFGMNLLDGFENAIIAIFVTLLDRVKLEGILSSSQLQYAFLTEGLFVQNSFFVDFYMNYRKIQAGFDQQLIKRKIENLNFSQFAELNLPSAYTDDYIARDRQEVQQQLSQVQLDILESGHNHTSSVHDSKRKFNTKNAYAEDTNLSNHLSDTKQMKQKVNVKAPYQVNRNEFYDEDSDYQENGVHIPDKKYLAYSKVKVDQHMLDD